jgi:hypothetical protein
VDLLRLFTDAPREISACEFTKAIFAATIALILECVKGRGTRVADMNAVRNALRD